MARLLTTETRKRVEHLLTRLRTGQAVSLDERIQLSKYALHIPFIAGKLKNALKERKFLDENRLI